MQFIFTTHKINNHVIFYLSGDLNYDGARTLKEAFKNELARNEKNFVLNMEGLKIIASYSLSTILMLSYLAKKQNGTLAIICPEGNVWDIFYVLEIEKVIPLFSSEEKLWQWEKNHAGTAAPAE